MACWARMSTVVRERLEVQKFKGCTAATWRIPGLEALEFKVCRATAWRIPGLLGQDANGNKTAAGRLRIQGLQSCSLEDSWLAGPGC